MTMTDKSKAELRGGDQEGSTARTTTPASTQIAHPDDFFICCFSRVREGHSADCARLDSFYAIHPYLVYGEGDGR